jgi:hypothetical protein
MRKHTEPIIWTLALLALFFMNPSSGAASFCVFKLTGFSSCPGCGIGHAIHAALHFNFRQSFHEHFLGIPTTVGILYHILHSFLTSKQSLTWTNNKC